MAGKRTYYQILNVDTQASEEEILRSARRLSEKYHPDRVAHLDPVLAKEYEQKMKEITEAKHCLCDPVARAKYNRLLRRNLMLAAPVQKTTQVKPVEVLTMEVIEDEDVDLQCPACSETFTVSKTSTRDYVQCPMCGKKGQLDDGTGGGGPEEDPEDSLQCPKCSKTMKLPPDLVPNETIIECPYCGARGTVG